MKNPAFLFLLAVTLLTGCTTAEVFQGEEQATQATATAVLKAKDNLQLGSVTLQLQQVDDSRCPMNAMCVRQGSAIAQVQVQDRNGATVTKRLYLGDALEAPENRGPRNADTVQVELNAKKYQIILSDVQPYPNTSDPNPAPKAAKLSLRTL